MQYGTKYNSDENTRDVGSVVKCSRDLRWIAAGDLIIGVPSPLKQLNRRIQGLVVRESLFLSQERYQIPVR